MVAFQNCSRTQFVTEEMSSLSVGQEILGCQAPTLSCETGSYTGNQSCSETPDGLVYGACVFQQCKYPGDRFDANLGQCVADPCKAGDVRVCTYQGQPSGTKSCLNTVWNECKCNPGYFLNNETQNCEKNFLKITGYLAPGSLESKCAKVTDAASFKASPECAYYFKVQASPNLTINYDASKAAISKLMATSPACLGRGDPLWDNIPWKPGAPLDPNARMLAIGGSETDGLNRWAYSKDMAKMMAGCAWQGTVTAVEKASAEMTSSNTYSASVMINPLCTPAEKVPNPACPSGTMVCSANGSTYNCTTATTTYKCASMQPACAAAGSCLLTTGNPATANQIWVKDSNNCGFKCTGGYSGPTCSMAPTTAPVLALSANSTMPIKSVAATPIVISEGGTAKIYVVSSQALSSSNIVQLYLTNSSASPGDYMVNTNAGNNRVTIASGATYDLITVVANMDSMIEGDEEVTISLSSSPSPLGNSGFAQSVKVTIKDVPSTTPTMPSGPTPPSNSISGGIILGGGSCTVASTTAGCGVGATSTWIYWGSGQPGGCNNGEMRKTAQVAGGVTGFVCVSPGAVFEPGAVLGGGSCTVMESSGGCGVAATSTWNYWGMGQSGGCASGRMQKTAQVAGGVTGFICVVPGTPIRAGTVSGGGSCTVGVDGGCGVLADSTWNYWGNGQSGGCASGDFQRTAQVAGGVTGFVCVVPATTYSPGALIGGGSCTVGADGGCGIGSTSTWSYWGKGVSGGCFSGLAQKTAQVAGGMTGFVCVTPGMSLSPGAVIGGGSCTVASATGGCGVGATSTWHYWGAGQSGGCSSGMMQKTAQVAGGVTGFLCINPGAVTVPNVTGMVLGGGSCTVGADGGCGVGATSTWNYWGMGQSGGCAMGVMRKTAQVGGGVTGFVCVVP